MSFHQAASEDFFDKFKCYFSIEPRVFSGCDVVTASLHGEDRWCMCHLRRLRLPQGHCFLSLRNYEVNLPVGGDAEACRPAAYFVHGSSTISVLLPKEPLSDFTTENNIPDVDFSSAIFYACAPPFWTSVRRTVAEYMHRTY